MKPAYHTPRDVPPSPETAEVQKKAFKNARRRTTESSGVQSSKKTHGPVPTLELYQIENCPFSHAVRSRLTRLGLDFVAHNVPDHQPLKHEQLVRAGGKDQVPFLIDHTSGVKLYESQAILAYLNKTYGDPAREDLMGRLAQLIDLRLKSRADRIAWRLSSPLLRAQGFELDARNALKTLQGTWALVRKRIDAAMTEARSKSQGAQATAGEKPGETKTEESRPAHA